MSIVFCHPKSQTFQIRCAKCRRPIALSDGSAVFQVLSYNRHLRYFCSTISNMRNFHIWLFPTKDATRTLKWSVFLCMLHFSELFFRDTMGYKSFLNRFWTVPYFSSDQQPTNWRAASMPGISDPVTSLLYDSIQLQVV